MSKKRMKQYLMLLCVIGLVSVAAGSGTFASFSAQTTNPNNTFAAGTLYLHDTPNGGTTCTSESATTGPNFNVNPGDGTNGNNCSALFTADLSLGRDFGENWSFSVNATNLLNSRYLLDTSNTFGGTHYVNPRQIALEVRYRFHY